MGELEAGLVAAVLGAPFAIISGGLATIRLTGWIAPGGSLNCAITPAPLRLKWNKRQPDDFKLT